MFMCTRTEQKLPYAALIMKLIEKNGIDTKNKGDIFYNFDYPIGNQSFCPSDNQIPYPEEEVSEENQTIIKPS